MALKRNTCGDWLDLPAEALAGEKQFRRWYAEHHWPFCRENPKRLPFRVAVAELRGPAQILVVRFHEQLNHPQLEIIPERAGATWRVLNRRTQSWPIVRVGDYLNITSLDDVAVIPAQAFDESYAIVETEQPPAPVAPAAEGAPVDAGATARA